MTTPMEQSEQTPPRPPDRPFKWIAILAGVVVLLAALLAWAWRAKTAAAERPRRAAVQERQPLPLEEFRPLAKGQRQAPRAKPPATGKKLKDVSIPGEQVPVRTINALIDQQYPWLFSEPKPRPKTNPVAPATERPAKTVNVVLVTVDTERADATTAGGQKLPTTPFFAALAAQGVTFKNAFSPAPWTVPAMYSMITGLYPREHGIVSGVVRRNNREVGYQEVLPDAAETLAERMKTLGYETYGVSTNYHLTVRYGFSQGFDRFVGNDFMYLPFPSLAVKAMSESTRAAPKFFLWVHYFDPHFPYVMESPWFGQWNDSELSSYFDLAEQMVLDHYHKQNGLWPEQKIPLDDVLAVNQLVRFMGAQTGGLTTVLAEYIRPRPDDDSVKFLRAAYLSEIRRTDEAIREALADLGIGDGDLVVVTADHGEEIFDHGNFGHRTGAIYQELLHVPLVVRLPGRAHAGTVVNAPVSTLDILPTILEVLGQALPGDIAGRSLVPLMEGRPAAPRPLFAEMSYLTGDVRVLIEYPWKYIHYFTPQKGALYDLAADPGEKRDLAETDKARAEAMHARLLEWMDNTPPRWSAQQGPPLSPAELKRLKQMGYVQ